MTTLQKTSRANTIRQRRSTQTPKERGREGSKPAGKKTSQTARQAYHPKSVFLPVEPRPVAPTTLRKMRGSAHGQTFGLVAKTKGKGSIASRMTKNSRRNHSRSLGKGYDLAINLGRTAVRAPVLSLPELGPRWISAGLTLLLGLMLYTLATANTFKVMAAEVTGNQRLEAQEVTGMLGLLGQPIYKAVPSRIETNLRTAFPDLASVNVQVSFPNHIRVAVTERTPILAWYQDGKATWIDSNGVAFMPRGDVQGLIQIAANGTPPTPPVNPKKSIFDQLFIDPGMVQAIIALSPQVPAGAPMIYDPVYGMGWQDPRGWSVYFGQNTQDIEMKKKVYQALLDTFSKQGIQPTLISVEYLDAPIYK